MDADLTRLAEHLPALVVVAVMAYGLAYLVAVDDLWGVTRQRVQRWAWTYVKVDGVEEPVGYRPTRRLPRVGGVARGKLVDLLSCPRCVGFWFGFAAWAVLTGGVPWPWAEPVWWVEVFAIRGGALFLSTRRDWIEAP